MEWTVGKQYLNFVVERVVTLPELQIKLIELREKTLGARIMHIEADDDENLFCLSFRTWPETSNGVAHILEHTVLCGSKKFPIRDPFFEMGRRSLNTFMNALTGADFTCYPAATQVPKDFYNLLEVYLDAVFHPLLKKESFLQEGHRLEFEKAEDPKTPLLYKGVVFNEMKGALASADARMGEALMGALFPDITYGVNSGGDPEDIPKLTYEQLKAFHSTYYHPSRCLYFFYGNLPLEKHLDFLQTHAFQDVKPADPLPFLPKQPRFTSKVTKSLTYPVPEHEADAEKSLLGLGWLTCSILDQEELLALLVLDLALMGTDASPLKTALLRSGLCKQTDSSLDIEMSEVPFTIVCKGCLPDSAVELEKIVFKTLEDIAEKGLPDNIVEGSIHQLEMSRSEITGNSSPYGLSLFFRSALLEQHGGLPEEGLQIHTLFRKLRERVQDPTYLTTVLRRQIIDNPHFVAVSMHPDPQLATKELAAELESLQLLKASLSETTTQVIVEQSRQLTESQENEEEDVDVLPHVTLEDISPIGKEFPLLEEPFGPLTVFSHTCFTNEMVYADLIFDLPEIAEEDLPLFRLFTIILSQVGCGGRNYKQHLDYILEHTGGVGVSLDLSTLVEDPEAMRPMLALKGKCLHRKMDKLFPLLIDIINSADFRDVDRIKELLMQHYYGLENSIHNHPLRYAVNLAASGLSTASRIINAWYGLDYFWKIKEVVQAFEKDPLPLIEKFEHFKKISLGLKGAHLVLGCQSKSYDELKKERFYGLADMPEKSFARWKGQYAAGKVESQGRIISSPVAFTALLLPSISYMHPLTPALTIAAEIMDNHTLHKRIREQGGAYGSGAVHAGMSSQFYFYSYRDPHIFSSVEAFKEATKEIAEGEFDESEIIEAKLGIIQDIDSPVAPGSRAMTAYMRLRGGRTPAIRQAFRERLLRSDLKEIQQSVAEHLAPLIKSGILVTFAAKELLEKENANFPNPLPLFPL